MADSATNSSKDLARGVKANSITDGGMIVGRVGEDEVLLARAGDRFFAVGAHCTHYHGPLAEGLVVGDTVRCPWHHACFSLETGEALPPSTVSRVGAWNASATMSSCETRCCSRPRPRAPERLVRVSIPLRS